MRQQHRMTHRRILVLVLLLIGLPLSVSGFGIGTLTDSIEYYSGEDISINYHIINEPATAFPVVVKFEGPIDGYARIQQDNHDWYGGRLSEFTATLTREFDLTEVSNATLRFNTEYYIEYGWDFGYVRVSTDNGSSWTQLQGVSTTTYRHPAASFGLPGSHSFTGTTNGLYQPEVMDLAPFVGDMILLRFSYYTDTGFLRPGWHVDDISIPEIGFFDDVEGFNTSWESNGWTRNFIEQAADSRVQTMVVEMNIPEDFDASNVSKLISTLTVGESAAATTSIIEILPGFVLLVRPTGGGSGGGGPGPGAVEDIKRISPKALAYTKSNVVPGILNVANFNHAASNVMRVEFRLSEQTSDVEIRVYALSGRPTETTELDDVFSYFEIDTVRIDDDKVGDAAIGFRVSKDWLDEHDHYLFDVVLSRFHDGEWEDLRTRLTGNDDDYYYYEARTPGFSYFAIRVKEKEGVEIEDVEGIKEAIDLEVVVDEEDILDESAILEEGLTPEEKEAIKLEIIDEEGRMTMITEGKKKEAIHRAPQPLAPEEKRSTDLVLILLLIIAGGALWVYRSKPPKWGARTKTAKRK